MARELTAAEEAKVQEYESVLAEQVKEGVTDPDVAACALAWYEDSLADGKLAE